MIDLIFFCFFIGTFACGFVAGKKYGSVKSMLKAAKTKIDGWFA